MHVIPFQVEHHKSLCAIFDSPPELIDDTVKYLASTGMAFSAMQGEQCIAWAGIFPFHRGIGEAYSYLSNEARAFGKVRGLALTRVVKKKMEEIVKEKSLHRVQINVQFGHEAGYRWAEALGFQWEGIMPMYASDRRTMVRYGRIWS